MRRPEEYFYEIQGVWKCSKILSCVFDISKTKEKTEKHNHKIYANIEHISKYRHGY